MIDFNQDIKMMEFSDIKPNVMVAVNNTTNKQQQQQANETSSKRSDGNSLTGGNINHQTTMSTNVNDAATKTIDNRNKIHCQICDVYLNSTIVYEQHLKGQKHLKKENKTLIAAAAGITATPLLPLKLPVTTPATSSSSSTTTTATTTNIQPSSSSSSNHQEINLKPLDNTATANDANQPVVISSNESTIHSSGTAPKANNFGGQRRAKKPPAVKFRCEVCKLDLTSEIDYSLHLKGQKHLKKFRENNRMDQGQSGETKVVGENGSIQQQPQPITNTIRANNSNRERPKCEICDVTVSTKEQMALHLIGRKHIKRVNNLSAVNQHVTSTNEKKDADNKSSSADANNVLQGMDLISIGSAAGSITTKATSNDNKPIPTIPSSSIVNKKQEDYKCEICDLNLITKDQLTIHLAGKKHLKKLNSISNIPENRQSHKPNAEDEMFANLNIAWEKYKIDTNMKTATGDKYEYYCVLCNKYMQRKLQLVDHLKSRKHHRRIYEKRSKENNGATNPNDADKSNLIKRKVGNFAKRGPIKFVAATSSSGITNNNNNNNKSGSASYGQTNVMANPLGINNTYNSYHAGGGGGGGGGANFNNQTFNKQTNNIDLTAAFEQPAPTMPTLVSYPMMQYYQPQHKMQPSQAQQSGTFNTNKFNNNNNNNSSNQSNQNQYGAVKRKSQNVTNMAHNKQNFNETNFNTNRNPNEETSNFDFAYQKDFKYRKTNDSIVAPQSVVGNAGGVSGIGGGVGVGVGVIQNNQIAQNRSNEFLNYNYSFNYDQNLGVSNFANNPNNNQNHHNHNNTTNLNKNPEWQTQTQQPTVYEFKNTNHQSHLNNDSNSIQIANLNVVNTNANDFTPFSYNMYPNLSYMQIQSNYSQVPNMTGDKNII